MALCTSVFLRSFSVSAAHCDAVKRVTVVGGGLMGSGIAQVAAQTGHTVTLVDVSEKILRKSRSIIQDSIERIAKKTFEENPQDQEKLITGVFEKITMTTDTEKAVCHTDIVIEAIVEHLDEKQKLFSKLDMIARKETIFASNTSSLTISSISNTSQRKDRFGGLHFFNPVPVMKLLEVIRIPETSDDTYATLMNFGKALGKHCVTCKDAPGFIVNRLLLRYSSEAHAMFDRGDATKEDIDTAMRVGLGYPMGPFELNDLTGLDTGCDIRKGWNTHYPHLHVYVSPTMESLVKSGKLGRKTGEGFYKYN